MCIYFKQFNSLILYENIKTCKEIKFKRLKSSRLERKKSHEKIVYKMKRPFSSTDNRRKNHKINFEISKSRIGKTSFNERKKK